MHGISTPRHVGALQREFGLRGGLSLSVHETVQPVAVIADLVDPKRPPFAGLAGGGNTRGPIVGNLVSFVLANPATSGLILEVLQIRLSAVTNTTFEYGRRDAGTVTAGGVGEARTWGDFNREGFPAAVLFSDTTLAVSLVDVRMGFARVFSAVQPLTIEFPQGVLVGPGKAFAVTDLTANNAGEVSFVWREDADSP